MIETRDTPIQVEESYFRGRRNYGRGRFLQGNDTLRDPVSPVGFLRRNSVRK